jgi:hypothetical protein
MRIVIVPNSDQNYQIGVASNKLADFGRLREGIEEVQGYSVLTAHDITVAPFLHKFRNFHKFNVGYSSLGNLIIANCVMYYKGFTPTLLNGISIS